MREAIDKYNAERDEYINNEVNKFRKDVPYQKALVQLRKEAEEKYLAENPEPSRDDDAHQQWWYGLEAAINNVDPFNDLNRLQNG
ncbi:MAG: hypothetical protein K2L88_02455, partial [Clostridiales bacterium]|nr:hypothetical protein [Clostridiales bacterium]